MTPSAVGVTGVRVALVGVSEGGVFAHAEVIFLASSKHRTSELAISVRASFAKRTMVSHKPLRRRGLSVPRRSMQIVDVDDAPSTAQHCQRLGCGRCKGGLAAAMAVLIHATPVVFIQSQCRTRG
jgi:hypothetical protein